jgi:hypothetical protein
MYNLNQHSNVDLELTAIINLLASLIMKFLCANISKTAEIFIASLGMFIKTIKEDLMTKMNIKLKIQIRKSLKYRRRILQKF